MAAGDRKIQITIGADGTVAVEGIDRVKSALGGMEKQSQSIFSRMRAHWLEMAAGVTAAYLALQKMWTFMDMAAKMEERMDTLNRLTSRYAMTADDLTGAISRVSRGLIGQKAAADVAVDALAKGFSPEQVIRMASLAETLAETSSESMTTADAFRQMETALVSARERGVVKLFGAMIDLESALGKEVATMSKAEKAQRIYDLAMAEGEKKKKALGDAVDSAADRMERFNNSIDEAKRFLGELLLLVGQPFMAVFNTALFAAYSLAGGVMSMISTLAHLTDQLGVTEGAAARFEKKADEIFGKAANQLIQAGVNMKAAWETLGSVGIGRGAIGGGIDREENENRKRQEQLTEIVRKFSEERDVIGAAEREKDLVRLEFWFTEQQTKLRELGAADAQYSALVETYAVKRNQVLSEQATKTADFYLAEQRRIAKENDEIEKARIKDEYDARERAAKERLDLENRYAKVWGETETAGIRRKADGEREILQIRQRQLLQYDEETTFIDEINRRMQEYRDLEREIEESKRRQAVDLDVRRVELQREITELTRQQRELMLDMRLRYAGEAAGRMGGEGAGIGQAMISIAAIAAGQDPYTKDYERWQAGQDKLVQAMEERHVATLDRLRYEGENEAAVLAEAEAQKAAIRDAYRQYDVMSDQMIAQQKYSTQMAYAQMAMGLVNMAAAFTDNKSKALFIATRGIIAAMSIISGHAAAMAALAPPPLGLGPVLGAPLAGAMKALGYINAAAIMATAFTGAGGGGGGGSPSLGASGAAALPAPISASSAQENKPAPSINIHVYGHMVDYDTFARQALPAFTKAFEDGVR